MNEYVIVSEHIAGLITIEAKDREGFISQIRLTDSEMRELIMKLQEMERSRWLQQKLKET